MNEQNNRKESRKRKGFVFIRQLVRIVQAILLFLRDKLYEDILLIARNSRLFIGIVFVGIGVLSFSSDRYCDGNASNYYTCTRPATYYYFPWWAMMFIITGTIVITLWYLRKKK